MNGLDPANFSEENGLGSFDISNGTYTTPAGAASIKIIYTSTGACPTPSEVVIQLGQGTTLIIPPPASICEGTPLDLRTVGGGLDVSKFSADAGQGIIAGNFFTPAGGAGIYTIIYTTGGCTDPTRVTVTVDARTLITIPAPPSICEGTTLDLRGVGMGLDVTKFSADASQGIISGNFFTPAGGAGTYTITYTTGGCTNPTPITVTVDPRATVTIAAPASICEGTTLDLRTVGMGLDVTKFSADASQGVVAGNFFTPAGGAGTYTITYTTGGCTNPTPITVTVDARATITIPAPPSICEGTTLDLRGVGTGLDVTKFSADASQGIVAGNFFTPAGGPGSYTITYTTGGCTNPTPITVTVDARATITIPAPPSICEGTTLDLRTVGMGLDLTKFSADASQGVIAGNFFTPAGGAGSYTITYTTGGCTNPTPIPVTVDARTSISIPTPPSICEGTTLDLRGVGMGLDVTKFSADASQGVISGDFFTPAGGAGTYTIIYTTGGCTNPTPITVTVDARTTITIPAPASICEGTTLDLRTVGMGLDVTKFSADASQGVIAGNFFTPAGGAGTYSITYTTGGCTNPTPITVTVDARTTVTIPAPPSICEGTTLDLRTVGMGLDVTNFSADASQGIIAGNFFTPAGGAGTYTIIYTTGGCTNPTPVTVTVDPRATVTIAAPASICEGTTLDLRNVGMGLDVTKFSADASQGVVAGNFFTPAGGAGTYTIIYTTGGCTNPTPITVTVDARATITIPAPPSICEGTTLDLRDVGMGLDVTKFSADASQGIVAGNFFTPAGGAGTYTIIYATGGCTNPTPITVTVDARTTVTIAAPASICEGTTLDLRGVGMGLDVTKFSADASQGIISGNFFTPAGGAGSYTITYTTGGCTNPTPITVTVDPRATVTITAPASICEGTTLDLRGVGGGLDVSKFSANASQGVIAGNFFTPAGGAGTYTITYTTGGCTNPTPITVTVDARTTITIPAPPSICEGTTLDLRDVGTGLDVTKFSADASQGVIAGNFFTPAGGAGTYTITYTTGGCTNATPVTVTVLPDNSIALSKPDDLCPAGRLNLLDLATGVDVTRFTFSAGTRSGNDYIAPNAAQTVTITYTPPAGPCAEPTTTTVTVLPANEIRLTPPPTNLCVNERLDLRTLNPSATFDLTRFSVSGVGAIDNNGFYSSPFGTSNVTITYTPTGACAKPSSVVFAVLNRAIDLDQPDDLCVGGSFEITSPNSLFSLEDSRFVIVGGGTVSGLRYTAPASVAAPTTVTLTYTTPGECPTETSISFLVSPAGVSPLTPPQDGLCASQTFDLNKLLDDPAVSGTFSVPADQGSITDRTYTAPTVTSSTDVTITFTPTGECVATTTASFAVRPKTVVTLSGPNIVCAEETLSLSLLGPVDPLRFTKLSGPGSINSAGVYEASTTTGEVVLAYAAGDPCIEASPFTFTVVAKPVVTLTAPAGPICVGEELDLLSLGTNLEASGFTIPGDRGSISATGVLVATSSGDLEVTYTSTAACAEPTTVSVVVEAPVKVGLAANVETCPGTSLALNDLLTDVPRPTGAWVDRNGDPLANGVFDVQIDAVAGPYTFTFVPTAGQCRLSETVVIEVRNTRILNIPAERICASDLPFDLADIEPIGDEGGTWFFEGAPSGKTFTATAPYPAAGYELVYRVSASGTTCAAQGTFTLTVTENEQERLTNPGVVCTGASFELIDLLNGSTNVDSFKIVTATSTATAQLTNGRFTAGTTAGIVTLSFRPIGDCAETSTVNIDIAASEAVRLLPTADLCVSGQLDLASLLPGGVGSPDSIRIVAGTGVIDRATNVYTASSVPGNVTFSYRAEGLCKDTTQLRFAVVQKISTSLVAQPDLCTEATIDLNALLTDPTLPGTFSVPNLSGEIVDRTYTAPSSPQASVTVTFTPDDPCREPGSTSFAVRLKNTVLLATPDPICINGTLDLAALGMVDPSLFSLAPGSAGSIDPDGLYTASGIAGEVTVRYGLDDPCIDAAPLTFDVLDVERKTLATPDPICLGATLDLLSLGQDLDPSRFTIDPAEGTIDASGRLSPSVEGDIVISYVPAGPCGQRTETTLRVEPERTISVVTDPQTCPGATLDLNILVLNTPRPLGVWTDENATVVSGGVYEVPADAVPRAYVFTFEPAAGQCYSTSTVAVTVAGERTVIIPSESICETALPFDLAAVEPDGATGGEWTFGGAPSGKTFAPTAPYPAGGYELTYRLAASATACAAQGTFVLTVNALTREALVQRGDLCVETDFELADLLSSSSSVAGFRILSGGGRIDGSRYVAGALAGRVTLSYLPEGDCVATTETQFEVTAKQKTLLNAQDPICVGGSFEITDLLSGADVRLFSVVNGNGNIVDDRFVAGPSPSRVTISYLPEGDCVDSTQVSFDVRDKVKVPLSPASDLCLSGTLNLSGLLPAGASTDGFTILSGGGRITAGTYTAGTTAGPVTLSYLSTGDCPDTSQVSFDVRDKVKVQLSPASDLCLSGTLNLSSLLPAGASTDGFTILSGGGRITAGTYTAGTTAGPVTLSYLSTGDCPDTSQVRFDVRDKVKVPLSPASDLCLSGTLNLSGLLPAGASTDGFTILSGGGRITAGTYTAGTTAGPVTLSYLSTGDCPDTSQVSFDVRDKVKVQLSPASDLCLSGTLNLSSLLPAGASTDGFTILSGGGRITAGTYTAGTTAGPVTLSYLSTGDCPDTSQVRFDVRDKVKVPLSPASDLCLNGTLNLSGLLPAGASTDGFSILSGGGRITAGTYTAGTTAGPVTLSYLSTGDCPDTSQVSFDVRDKVKVPLSPASDLCLSGTLNLSGLLPAGASTDGFSILSGGGRITAGTYTAGTTAGPVTLSYLSTGDCPDTSQVSFDVRDKVKVPLSPASDLCLSGTLNLSGLLPAGASTDGFTILSGGGRITAGTYTAGTTAGPVTLSYLSTGDCPDTSQVRFDVRSSIAIRLNPQTDICLGERFSLSTLLPGGDLTNFRVEAGDGTIVGDEFVAGSTASRIVLSYTPTQACTDSAQVRFNVSRTRSVSLLPSPRLCAGDTLDLLSLLPAGAPTGTFEVPGGGGRLNGNVFTAGQDARTVRFRYVPIGTCTDTSSVGGVIVRPTAVGLAAGREACAGIEFDLNTLVLNQNLVAGGLWKDGSGVSYPTGRWQIPVGTPSGAYTFIFTPRPGQCTTVDSTTLTVGTVQTIAFAPLSVCGPDFPINLRLLEPAGTEGGVWSFGGSSIPSKVFDPVRPYQIAPYRLTYRLPASAQACAAGGTLAITVRTARQVRLAPPIDSACSGAEIDLSVLVLDGTPGTWKVRGVDQPNELYVIPEGPGGEKITFVFVPESGCVAQDSVTTVRRAPSIAELMAGSICDLRTTFNLNTLVVDPALQGGTWTGVPPGNVRGQRLELAGLPPGNIALTYLPPGSCAAESSTVLVRTVAARPSIADQNVCRFSLPLDLTTLEPDGFRGGVWTGFAVSGNVLDPGSNPVASYEVRYGFADSLARCVRSVRVAINISSAGTPELRDTSVCRLGNELDLALLRDPRFPQGTWTVAGSTTDLGQRLNPINYASQTEVRLQFRPGGIGCSQPAFAIVRLTPPATPALLRDTTCANNGDYELERLLPPGVPNGTWTGPPSLTFVGRDKLSTDGLVPGPLVLTFKSDDPCFEETIATLDIGPEQKVTLRQGLQVCSFDSAFNLRQFLLDTTLIGSFQVNTSPVPGDLLDARRLFPGRTQVVFELASGCFGAAFSTLEVLTGEPLVLDLDTVSFCSAVRRVDLDSLLPPDLVGGTWSGTPRLEGSRLDISTPGRLAITYTPANDACGNSKTITFNIAPTDNLSLPDTAVCGDLDILDLTALEPATARGGVWSRLGSPIVGGRLRIADLASGDNELTYETSGACAPSGKTIVTLGTAPAIVVRDTFICRGSGLFDLSAIVAAGSEGGTWSGPGVNRGSFAALTTGRSTLLYTADGTFGCASTAEAIIAVVPELRIRLDSLSLCTDEDLVLNTLLPDGVTGGRWLDENADTVTAVRSDVPVRRRLTFGPNQSTPCSFSSTLIVNISGGGEIKFAPITLCGDASPLVLANLPTGSAVGGSFQDPDGNLIDEFDPNVSTSTTLTFTSTSGGCSFTGQLDIFVVPAQKPIVVRGLATCRTAPSFPLDTLLADRSIPGDWLAGTDTIRSLVPGNFSAGPLRLVFVRKGGCRDTASVVLTILEALPVALRQATVCPDGDDFDLTTLLSNGLLEGSWQGTGLTIAGNLLSTTGLTPGTYSLTFRPTGDCLLANRTSIVVATGGSPEVRPINRCLSDEPIAVDTALVTAVAGLWTLDGTAVDSIVPSTLGEGAFRFLFTPSDPCLNPVSTLVNITPLVDYTVPSILVCTTTVPVALGNFEPSGVPNGTWSGPSVRNDSLVASVTGDFAVMYTPPTGSCAGPVTVVARVTSSLVPVLNPYTTCLADGAFPLSLISDPAFPNGSWLASPGIVGLTFDPALVGAGTYTLTFVPDGDCAEPATVEVIIEQSGTPLLSTSVVCKEDTAFDLGVLRDSEFLAGTWSVAGEPLVDGLLDAAAYPVGPLELSFTPDGTCAQTATTTVSIIGSHLVELRDTTVCADAGRLTLASLFLGGPVDGTWTGFGRILTETTIDLTALDTGTYALSFTPDSTCGVATQSIVKVGTSDTTLLASRQFCSSAEQILLGAFVPAGSAGGVWSGPAVTGNSFSPRDFGREGVDTLIYRFGESCPRIFRLPIRVNSSLALTVDTLSVCLDSELILAEYDPADLPGGFWTLDGQIISTVTASSFTDGAPLAFVYTPPAGACASAPVDRYLLPVTPLVVTLSLDTLCVSGGAVALGAFTSPAGVDGTWSGEGVTPGGLYTPGRLSEVSSVSFTPFPGCNSASEFTFDLVDVGALTAETPSFSCTGNTYTATVVIDTHSNNGTIIPSIGTLVGTVLTIGNLVSGSAATVTLSDGASCSADLAIDLSTTCAPNACEAVAGSLTQSSYLYCEGETIRFDPAVSTELGTNDVLRYFLDDDGDPDNGSILTSATPTFAFDRSYLRRVLRVYAVAALQDASGGIDLGDPCRSQSNVATVRYIVSPLGAVAGAPVCSADNSSYTITVTLPGMPQDYTSVGSTPGRLVTGANALIFGPVASGSAVGIAIEAVNNCGRFEFSTDFTCSTNCRPASAGTFQPGPVTLCGDNLSSNGGYNRDPQTRSGDGQVFIVYADARREVALGTFRNLPIDFTQYLGRGSVYLASRVGVRSPDGTLDPDCSIETVGLQEIRFGESPVATRDTVVCATLPVQPITLYGQVFTFDEPTQTVTKPSPTGGCDSLVTLTVQFVTGDRISIRQQACEGDTLVFGGRTFTVANPSDAFTVGNANCSDAYDVEINFRPASRNFITRELCRGDSVVVGSQIFNFANPRGEAVLEAINGCDSIVSVSLTFPDPPTVSFSILPVDCDPSEVRVEFVVVGGRNVRGLVQNGPGTPTDIELPAGTSVRAFPITADLNIRLTELRAVSGGCPLSPSSPITIRREVSRLNSSIDVPLAGEFSACPGSPVPSIAVVNTEGIGPYQYAWSRGDTTRTILEVEVGDYSVTVTDAFGCTSESTVSVVPSDTIAYVISATDPICPDGLGSVTIDLLDSAPGLRYRFDLPGLRPVTDDVIFVDSVAAGRYVFQLLQPEGCGQNTFIDVIAPPTVNPIVADTIVTRLGQEVELMVPYGVPANRINWLPGDAFSCDTCSVTTVFPTGSGLIGVQIVDSLGCNIEDAVYLLVEPGVNVFIPNAFSPNDDGVNDVFEPLMGPEVRRVLSFEVYSRWGEPVHQRFGFRPGDTDGAWDGTWKGKAMDTAVFGVVVKVELINGEEEVISGDVGLFR